VINDDNRRAITALADRLESGADDLAAGITRLCRDELPGFADMAPAAVHAATCNILMLVLRRLREGGGLDAAEMGLIAERARGWASAGVPLPFIVRGFQLGVREMLAAMEAEADAVGLDASGVLYLHDFAWEFTSTSTGVLAEVEREIGAALVRTDVTGADFLRDAAHGRLTAQRLADEAPAHGLDPETEYVAVRAHPGDAAAVTAIDASVRRSGATADQRTLQTSVDDEFFGLAPQCPSAPEGALIAVGPPARLSEAHESFAAAGEALEAASAFGLTGTVDLGSLGPLPLALADERLAEMLAARHLERLDSQSRAGKEIEQTVLTLLDHDQNVERAAAALHLHGNTVRYRVRRFRELTGLDLHCTDDLVTAWWLLKWRTARRSQLLARTIVVPSSGA
jgi:hypothetical protein